MQGIINCKHPKRTYNNANGSGEISTWDLLDDSGSINLVAFNLNSNLMAHRLIEGRVKKNFYMNHLFIIFYRRTNFIHCQFEQLKMYIKIYHMHFN